MLRWLSGLLIALSVAAPAMAVEPPAWLPRYDLDIDLDTANRLATVKQKVTFTNRHDRPATELVFNAHGRYTIPDDQVGFMAKTAEILRLSPKEAFYFDGPPMDVKAVRFGEAALPFHYGDKNPCSFIVPLPVPVEKGQSITVEIDFRFKIPAKKGRWSQWEGVTALAQWLPTLAVYDNEGWHALPFIPWHQPFYNEAGVYTARITLPCEQKLACPMPIQSKHDVVKNGIVQGMRFVTYSLEPAVLRDFSLTCSANYEVLEGNAGRVKVRCLYLPQHAHYGKILLETVCQALPVYEKWFGPYPYAQFTIAEACFGWNGNECSAMVLIDERMFNMPHMCKPYPVYLVQHELCHQWFYNIIGTNGYAETFVDEGLATYFSHKLADQTLGRNNKIIDYPTGLKWMPNIHREDLRLYGLVGARARGEMYPTVQEMDKFGHLAALLAYTYDRGGKIFGQIEARLGGEEAMLDFMRTIYRKYAFRIFRVEDLKRELELYTGRSWDDFFRQWVYSPAMVDWRVAQVEINGHHGPLVKYKRRAGPVQVTVDLVEQDGFPEPCVLGIALTDKKDCFDIRIPIDPSIPIAEFPEYGCRIESRLIDNGPNCVKSQVRVVLTTATQPRQIVVDPDRVLLDSRPQNNSWVPHVNIRPTPLYTMLDEVDVTNSYDRWSLIFGPWIGTSTTIDPWYTRSPLAGFKVGTFRTQQLNAGAFIGYRTNDRNVVAGVEATWQHAFLPQINFGVNVEQALTSLDDDPHASRGVLYSRYVMQNGSSLLMPPIEYVEAFGTVQDHPLPTPYTTIPNTDPFYQRTSLGVHYHKFYLTPYWDAEGGAAVDLSAQYGIPVFGQQRSFQLVQGQVSTVKSFPSLLTSLSDGPISRYLQETRFAFRAAGAAALPDDGLFFSLGGGDQFRGFDIRQRQGSITWVGSIEWRVPVFQNCHYDCLDRVAGVRNVYLAPFYDVGQAYVNGAEIGSVAHALGLGLRVDVQWIGIIERTMLRVDVAQAINQDTPTQVWFGFMHPF